MKQDSTETQLPKHIVMRSAYGEHWEKVKEYVNEKGWCKIIPELNIYPGTCGMVALGYQIKRLEPNTNYMGWSHFRPKELINLG